MKIKPCKRCGCKDIELYDCGYLSFNCYGGRCENCGYQSGTSTGSCFPTEEEKIELWNKGQKPDKADKLQSERVKCRKLRRRLKIVGFPARIS